MRSSSRTALACLTAAALCSGASAADYTISYIGNGVPYGIDNSGRVAIRVSGSLMLFDGESLQQILIPKPTGVEGWTNFVAMSDDWMMTYFDGSHDYVLWNTRTGYLDQFHGLRFGTGLEGQIEILYLSSINRLGQVVGTRDTLIQEVGITVVQTFLDAQGVIGGAGGAITTLPSNSSAVAINDAGFVTGCLSTNKIMMGDPELPVWFCRRACIYTPQGEAILIDQRPVPDQWWTDPNNRWADGRGGGELYDWSSGTRINDQNWVAGWILPSAMEVKRAFLYKDSEMLDLGPIGKLGAVTGLNSYGDVTISSRVEGQGDAPDAPLLYHDGVLGNLNHLVTLPSGVTLTHAAGINDRGQILAIGKKAIKYGWMLNEVFLINPPGLGQPPVISIQPAGGTVGSGDPLQLVVSAIGGLPLEYQWLKDGQPIPGANQREYSVAHVDGTHAGSYQVRVTNQFGEILSNTVVIEVPDLYLDILVYAAISLNGDVGSTYRIEFKSSLTDPTWIPLPATVTLTNSPQLFIDTSAPLTRQRVYQAVQVD
jgi:hypothetical protein